MSLKQKFINKLMVQRKNAYDHNKRNIKTCVDSYIKMDDYFCDLGCDDGEWTSSVTKGHNLNLYGLEIIDSRRQLALMKGIIAEKANLNDEFPYENYFFDMVHANQVIEHVTDTDHFVSEIYRILKPGGCAVISTENLSSWHNIFALFFGFTPFSLVNAPMQTAALGNPLAPHNDEEFWTFKTWQHIRVFTLKGLIHLFELYGFKIEKKLGSGYYPIGNWVAKFDLTHCAFITLCVRKPNDK